ncbi:hypothetical protein LG274_02710 [Micrococcus antarcticus]|uniref:hypothetical protein n=1 Tax=Micrococcus antarcticus TaxID=86171 RepID=UPI00384DCBDF
MRTTNGAADYIELGGVRLDGYGWNYDKAVGASAPAVRSAAVSMPGRPGRVYVAGTDVHDPAEVVLQLHVQPRNPITGAKPGTWGAARAQLEDNLQTLLGLVGSPGRATSYVYVDADGERWTAQAVVVTPAKVKVRDSNLTAEITVTVELPGVYLRSEEINAATVQPGASQSIFGLGGGTAPIYDALLTLPSGVRVESGGQWIVYRGAGAAQVDCGNMTAVNTVTGASVMKDMGWSGSAMLPLIPSIDPDGGHQYKVTTDNVISIVARKARFA